MIFNNYDFKDLFTVENIERSLLPTVYNQSMMIPGQQGSRFIRSELGIGVIRVRIRIIKESREEVQETMRIIAAKLHNNKPSKLLLRDDSRYNMAIVSGLSNIEKFLHTGLGFIEFECHDPFSYGEEKIVYINQLFTNDGTYPAKGIIEFTASIAERIEIFVQGKKEKLILNYDFKGYEAIIIDLEKQLITMNDNNAMKYLSLESDFFTLPVGTNNKIIALNCTGTVTFRERWL